MCPDRHPHGPRRWSLRSSSGEIAFAGLLLAAASGIALAMPYDVERPYDSLALLLLTNPAGAFFRNLHYWTAQVFLVLTLAHTWVQLARWTETRVPHRVWWRTAASLPLAGFVMLSGFMLKGDAEAQQALRLVGSLLDLVPWLGGVLSAALFGIEGHRQVLYVHHVATASLLVWLFVAEHARAIWPRLAAIVETLAPAALVSLFVSPALHDGIDPLVKGPWYFLGLQEALHWSRWPIVVVSIGVAAVALVAVLPRLSEPRARAAKVGLASALAAYALLSVVGVFFRGADWSLTPAAMPWHRAAGRSSGLVVHGLGPWLAPLPEAVLAAGVPAPLGRREGCLLCHTGVSGLSRSHSAEAVGCASCHAGNPFSYDKDTAHAGLVPVPGNLSSAGRACGAPGCHPSQVERVPRSLMATMAGIVSVDRAVWSGRVDGSPPSDLRSLHVTTLGRTGADSHLRQLCASCHLGAEKASPGPNGEDARGGGCLACHLRYGAESLSELTRYRRDPARPPGVHPDVTIAIDRMSCFGCHSRSGRISTSYEGWHEVGEGDPPLRRLADGRRFTFVAADVHARAMDCIDCHTAREVMGDGELRLRAHQAVRVTCEDCHRPRPAGSAGSIPPATVPLDRLDAESRKIAELRGRNRPGERFVTTAAGADPLLNTSLDDRGGAWLVGKASGKRLPMKPAASACTALPGHERLSCISCHAAWAPRCPTCHTSFDPTRDGVDLLDGDTVRGAWIEQGGSFDAAPPTLGIRREREGCASQERIDTFIPGMVMTLDRNQSAGAKPDAVFRRLYARSFSHTIGRAARSCESCHADPIALGYGAGELRYERDGVHGHWRFKPRFGPGPDGLPADAWIGFLRERTASVSTGADLRPFTLDEQRRILTVGSCLACHAPAAGERGAGRLSSLWQRDFRAALARPSPQCVLPQW